MFKLYRRLDLKPSEWQVVMVHDLEPSSFYTFRARARSPVGWGMFGPRSGLCRSSDGPVCLESTAHSLRLTWPTPPEDVHPDKYELQMARIWETDNPHDGLCPTPSLLPSMTSMASLPSLR